LGAGHAGALGLAEIATSGKLSPSPFLSCLLSLCLAGPACQARAGGMAIVGCTGYWAAASRSTVCELAGRVGKPAQYLDRVLDFSFSFIISLICMLYGKFHISHLVDPIEVILSLLGSV
jgi:hypothetical protein